MDDLGDIMGSLIEVIADVFSDVIVAICSVFPWWVNTSLVVGLVSLITWLCLR